MSSFETALKERASELGFALVGVADARPSEHGEHYTEWLARGLHGEMGYLERPDAVRRRLDLEETLPGVHSVVVVADEYFIEDASGIPDDPSVGVVARYARGADYHRVLRRKLDRLLDWVRSETDGEVNGRAYVDTGPLLERELARRAGLGWFGKNTMLIHPRRGSYFFVGALLLDVALSPDPPFTEDRCGSCRACLDVCPTGALLGRDEAGAPVMDARRCISYLTIEQRGPIPRELRPLIGNRIYGCDICQEVCPFNQRFATPASEPRYAARGPGERPVGVEALPEEAAGAAEAGARGESGEPVGAVLHPGTEAPSLIALLETALDPDAWDAFSRASAIRRAGRAGFARNVCVALGNWGSPEAVPVLASGMCDPEPLVRGHAAWALGEIGTSEAMAALSSRIAEESDEAVVHEIRATLGS